MSTILDALRKLQGDREGLAAPPARDLRSSVLDAPLPQVRVRRRPEAKVRPLIAALGGGGLVAAGVATFLYWNDGEVDPFVRAAGDIPADASLLAEAESPPSPPAEIQMPRAPEPLVNLAAPPQPPAESPEARYAAFQPPQPQEPAPEPAAQPQAVFEPPQTFAPVNKRARPRADVDASHGEVIPYPDYAQPNYGQPGQTAYAQPPAYEPPQIVTRSGSKQDSQQVELESSAMKRARERLAKAEGTAPPRPSRERRAEAAPRDEPPVREEAAPRETAEAAPLDPAPVESAVSMQFPELEVQSVLWHPDPLRRQATIVIDGQLATDAREGDLIGGVMIDRITPGSVDFRVGQERKRVDMTP